MKNKIRSVRIAKKGRKTILHKGLTESIKNTLKAIKRKTCRRQQSLQKTNIQMAIAIH